MSGKNPDSSDKFIVVDNMGSNSSRQSFKILVGAGSSKQDFVGALSTSFLKESMSTRRKAVKGRRTMRRMAVNSAAQFLSCIKANTKIRYFLNKERPHVISQG